MIIIKPKITFERMAIENFGPFHGYHEFDFSKDENKNVTLITGKMGSGKTSIFQLFWWILFPKETDSKKRNEMEYLRSEETINVINGTSIQNTKIGDPITIRGIIQFEWTTSSLNRTSYLITRERSYEKKANIELNDDAEEFDIDLNDYLSFIKNSDKIQIEKNGSPIEYEEYISLINQIFPKAIRKFAFIHGEGMTKIMSIENVGELKKSVLDVSDFPKIHAMAKYIGACKSHFDKKRKSCAKDVESLTKKSESIEKEKVKLEKKMETLEKYNELSAKFNDKIIEIETELGKLEHNSDDINQYEGILKELESLKKQKLGEIRGKKKKRVIKGILDKRSELLRTYAPYLYLEEAIKACLKDIKDKRELGIIPGLSVPKLYLEIILNRAEACVCNTPWDLNGKMKNAIKEEMQYSIQNSLITSLNQFEGWLTAQKKVLLEGKRELLEIQQELLKVNTKIHELDQKKRAFERGIKEDERNKNYVDQIKGKYEEKEGIAKELAKIEGKKEITEENIKTQKEVIKKLEQEYNKLETEKITKKGGKDAFYYKNIYDELCQIDDLNEQLATEIGERIREETRKETERILVQLVKDPDNWSRVNIMDSGVGWLINARFASTFVKNISTGMTNVLGLSFICALSNIVDIELPLIFDSPLGNLDDETRELVCENLPPIFKGRQIIFLDKMVNFAGQKDKDSQIIDLYPVINKYIEYEYKVQNPEKYNAEIILVR